MGAGGYDSVRVDASGAGVEPASTVIYAWGACSLPWNYPSLSFSTDKEEQSKLDDLVGLHPQLELGRRHGPLAFS